MVRCISLLLAVFSVVGIATADSQPIRYRIQVYRLAGGFQMETSLENEIWRPGDMTWDSIKGDVTLFERGTFCWGKKAKLTCTPEAVLWNKKMLSLDQQKTHPAQQFKLIYAPDFQKKPQELARLKIEAKAPFQYLQRRDDGLFELAEVSLPVGMDLEVKGVRSGANTYAITYLEIELRTVGRRKPVSGVNLEVGYPIVDECEYHMGLNVVADRSYHVLLKPEGISGAVIVRITTGPVASKTGS